MRPSTMISSVKQNARDYEGKLRQVEQQLADASTIEIAIERKIATNLAKIASLHIDQYHALDADVQRQLDLRNDEESSMRQQLAAVEKNIAEMVAGVDATSQDVDQAIIRVQALLHEDLKFRDLLVGLEAAEKENAAVNASQEEVLAECERKLVPYSESKMHRYLTDCKFGTADYASTGLIRLLDGWIAQLCNYQVNRKNEETLLAMQEELLNAGEVRAAWIKKFHDSMSAMQQAAERQVGTDRLERTLKKRRDALAAEKKRANDIHDVLVEYANKTDIRYVRARSMIADAMKSESADALIARAAKTPDTTDDGLVMTVIELQKDLKRHHDRYAHLNADRGQAAKDYDKAKKLERRLQDSSYTGGQYEYGRGLDISSLILGYMAGQISTDSAASEVRRHRQEVETESSSSWSSSSSSSSSSSWSSSSSSDSFSTSSSSGGDSYSTSDSF